MPNSQTSVDSARVLVVDDEANMRRTLGDILRDEGYDVVTAATGDEAVELCSRERFAIRNPCA